MSQSIGPKVEEMIALGVAYALNCHKCMKVHKKFARDAGLSPQEMNEALSVAEGVINGARNLTKEAVEEIFGSKVEDNRCCPVGSECCP